MKDAPDNSVKQRNASSVAFGFDFQVHAAMVLMLENLLELKNIRVEGKTEDIEIELKDNSYIFAQAKSIVNSSSDFHNVLANLKKALTSLSEAAATRTINKLVFITNSPNPFNTQINNSIFVGHSHRDFKPLPEQYQRRITEYLKDINTPLDTNNLMIHILPFETDNNLEKYKVVISVINEFISNLELNGLISAERIRNIWFSELFANSSKKDTQIVLSKNDLIWPLIVIITDISYTNSSLREEFDSAEFEEISRKYKSIINYHCEKYEYFTRVVYDYQNFTSSKKGQEKIKDFIELKWKDYKEDFAADGIQESIKSSLIKIIIHNVLQQRFKIDKIKEQTGL